MERKWKLLFWVWGLGSKLLMGGYIGDYVWDY